MKLLRLKAKNYRSLRDVSIDLEDFNVFIGANARPARAPYSTRFAFFTTECMRVTSRGRCLREEASSILPGRVRKLIRSP